MCRVTLYLAKRKTVSGRPWPRPPFRVCQINYIKMKNWLKTLAALLLSLIGFSSLYAGWALMVGASAALEDFMERMKLPPSENYFIPGAIMFFVVGWGSMMLVPTVIKGQTRSKGFLILAGMIISTSIALQAVLSAEIHWVHALYLCTGFALIYLALRGKSKTVTH